jgi:hypothetical protein
LRNQRKNIDPGLEKTSEFHESTEQRGKTRNPIQMSASKTSFEEGAHSKNVGTNWAGFCCESAQTSFLIVWSNQEALTFLKWSFVNGKLSGHCHSRFEP